MFEFTRGCCVFGSDACKLARVPFAICALLLFTSGALLSQEVRATVSGRVTDPQDASIAGAQVEVKNVDTGVTYPGVTTTPVYT